MADNLTPNDRSLLMAKVSGKETKPEIIVRKFLFSNGLRYRKNVKSLPGTPDVVLKKYKTIIFVHGCFWHGHESCRASKLPSTNVEFWVDKREKNLERDKNKILQLEDMGWKVLIVWECEIKMKTKRESRLTSLLKEILNLDEKKKTL